MVTTAPALAQVNLAATIRDFNNSDSSFNASGISGVCRGTGFVESTLGPNRKPVPTRKFSQTCTPGDSARLANDWFTTDPTYTQSATTCIDIPMHVDSNGIYTYRNPYFFPIDTFNTLPNGKPNPFNVQYLGDDGKMHNFSFCMEMHGTFDARAGQTFNFLGDDDVWFFINNRLVVDLGGIHTAESSSVNLDTLGLTPGQTYPWDFFFCERHTSGSDILINTSMNLRTSSNFTVQDSVLGVAYHRYSLWVDQSNASSCVASNTHSNGTGQFTLTGGSLASAKSLPSGTWYGGIVVAKNLGSISLDSSLIVGLAPGNYVLHIYQQGSTTSSRDIPFVVPGVVPVVVRTLQFADSTGSTTNLPPVVTDVYRPVPVYIVASLVDGAVCSTCRDSVSFAVGDSNLRILASPTGAAVTSIRLSGGKAKVWVVSGVPIDSTKLTASSDTSGLAVRWPVSVLAPRLVFVDTSGNILSPVPALDIPLGTQSTLTVEILTSTGLCSACTDSLTLVASSKQLLFSDPSGKPITRLLLEGGKASFQLSGWAPVQGATISVTTDHLLATAGWTPISVSLGAISGTLVDSDADGRADLLDLTLPVDASVFSAVSVSWPAQDGSLDFRSVPLSTSGKNIGVPLPPFAFGSTSCPTSGCADLGRMEIVHGTDTASIPFDVLDGVDPIPVQAQYRFSVTGTTPDTLVATFSEPVTVKGAGPWVSTGHPGLDSLGNSLVPLATPPTPTPDQKVVSFLLSENNGIRPDDSLRIAAKPSGALSDTAGNAPGELAWWTPIAWGQSPAMLTLLIPHPVVGIGTGSTPPDEPAVTLLIHADPTQTTQWVAAQGPTPGGLDTRFSGVVLRLNRIPENLGIYVYDNLGVQVLREDLPKLADLVSSGVLQRDLRGNYEIWLGWNGKDGQGRETASGVYLIRVFGWFKEANKLHFLNQIKTVGIHRTLQN
jgi:fibro-slime domain-containing protein